MLRVFAWPAPATLRQTSRCASLLPRSFFNVEAPAPLFVGLCLDGDKTQQALLILLTFI